MKIECLKKQVDLNKIHYAIDKFKAEHYGDNPSYIVMNSETKYNILDNNQYYCVKLCYNNKEIRQRDELFGISVALCEELKFGEVDIV